MTERGHIVARLVPARDDESVLEGLIAEGKAKPFIIVMDNGGNIGGGFKGAKGPKFGKDANKDAKDNKEAKDAKGPPKGKGPGGFTVMYGS